ncbi:MAG: hypothetical protein QOJ62_584 [Actinomycetota bacterium]|jgi:anti-anti-sigma regulatory factor|nr:hypothetical protein [Actinomycetota bacterium]
MTDVLRDRDGAFPPEVTYELDYRQVRGWHLVIMRGLLLDDAVPALQLCLDTVLAEELEPRVLVDVARIDAISADCLFVIAATDREIAHRGGELRLVLDDVSTLQAIREAGLSGRFHINRYVGDVVGAVPGLDEVGRGSRRKANAHRFTAGL